MRKQDLANNKEFKEIHDLYKESKRFIDFASRKNGILHDSTFDEEVKVRRKILFNFECSLALLDDLLNEILTKDITESNSLWYVGYLSRSTYYRNRKKAIETFLHNYHRLETL